MSLLQRLARSSVRAFSTTTTAAANNTTTTTSSAKGLAQFFENGEALPKQIWTGAYPFSLDSSQWHTTFG